MMSRSFCCWSWIAFISLSCRFLIFSSALVSATRASCFRCSFVNCDNEYTLFDSINCLNISASLSSSMTASDLDASTRRFSSSRFSCSFASTFLNTSSTTSSSCLRSAWRSASCLDKRSLCFFIRSSLTI